VVIRFKESFVRRLEIQIAFIALDSPLRAAKFKQDLFDKIKRIPANPHAFRKSR
jgi:plasmid stabilization system protein ParE